MTGAASHIYSHIYFLGCVFLFVCFLLAVNSNIWGTWGAWTQCTLTCGSSIRFRFRQCILGRCVGRNQEISACNLAPCTSKHCIFQTSLINKKKIPEGNIMALPDTCLLLICKLRVCGALGAPGHRALHPVVCGVPGTGVGYVTEVEPVRDQKQNPTSVSRHLVHVRYHVLLYFSVLISYELFNFNFIHTPCPCVILAWLAKIEMLCWNFASVAKLPCP